MRLPNRTPLRVQFPGGSLWAIRELLYPAARHGLRVKIKSLAAEARIIREEAKRFPEFCGYLHGHNVEVVRPEARSTQIAYAYLRGRKYRECEPKAKAPPDVKRIATIAKKYGVYGAEKGVEGWLSQ